MSAFKMNSILSNSRTFTSALYANQIENRATDADDTEILYYSNGSPTSSAALTFDGSALGLDGDLNVVGNITAGYDGPTGLNNGIEIVTRDPSAVYMDVHTLSGANNDFDYRIIFGGGETGESAGGSANFEGVESNFFSTLRATPAGAPLAPNWYMDYGEVLVTPGTNQITTIAFNTAFASPPKVIVQVVDLGPGTTVDNFTTYIQSTSTSACVVQGYGVVSAGFSYNWIAIGGV
jgi:hypothetical protein